LEYRQEFCHSDLIHLLDLLEPSERGLNLTSDEDDLAMKILTTKILKNPIFAGQEVKVSLIF